MQPTQERSFRRHASLVAAMLLLFAGVVSVPATPTAQKTPDVSGDWQWEVEAIIMGPADAIMLFFGIPESEGPVMRLICHTQGTMTLDQDGTSFTGSADQDGSCITQGGQSSTTTPFPPSFSITGSVNGHSMHFDADVGEGIVCPYRGSVAVESGVATQLNATGRCMVPIPIHPLLDVERSFDASRL